MTARTTPDKQNGTDRETAEVHKTYEQPPSGEPNQPATSLLGDHKGLHNICEGLPSSKYPSKHDVEVVEDVEETDTREIRRWRVEEGVMII